MDRFIICPFNFIENFEFEFYSSLRADQSNFRVAPDNGWRHSASPRTTGGDTPRRPGQRVATLRVAPDNGCTRRRPGQRVVFTRRRPGQRVVFTRRRPGQRWDILFLCGFCMEKDSKIFFASTWTTGGKHSALPRTTGGKHSASPRTTGGNTPRRPGQRVITLRVAQDDGHSHSAPTRTAWRALDLE